MNTYFADTSYYLAQINPKDDAHGRAVNFSAGARGTIVTTSWVLMELANTLAAPVNRDLFMEWLKDLRSSPHVVIIPASHQLFERGVNLYADLPDKGWSLTDCISFLVMRDRGIVDALTADHHFEQAGFRTLLKAG